MSVTSSFRNRKWQLEAFPGWEEDWTLVEKCWVGSDYRLPCATWHYYLVRIQNREFYACESWENREAAFWIDSPENCNENACFLKKKKNDHKPKLLVVFLWFILVLGIKNLYVLLRGSLSWSEKRTSWNKTDSQKAFHQCAFECAWLSYPQSESCTCSTKTKYL